MIFTEIIRAMQEQKMKNEEKQKEKSITVKKDKKKPEDLLQGKFRHFTGDIEVDDNKKENKRVIPNTVSNVYQSPTAKTIEKPFSNKNINHKW